MFAGLAHTAISEPADKQMTTINIETSKICKRQIYKAHESSLLVKLALESAYFSLKFERSL